MAELNLTLIAPRFWAKVNKTDGCWLWTSCITKHRVAYGRFWAAGKTLRAHRLSWQLTHGEIPVDLCVLHRCDEPLCVNPAHLFLGTMKENIADRDQKGRTARGERNGWAKNTTADVLEVRRLLAMGLTQQQIVLETGLSVNVVHNIKSGRGWKCVPTVRTAASEEVDL